MKNKNQSYVPTSSDLFSVYQSLESRRATYDTAVWQTTSISLAAQSFLITLALSRDSKPSVRVIAASLSFVIALMTMQLMAKHRWGESIDSKLLENLEKKLGFQEMFGALPHESLQKRISNDVRKTDLKRLGETKIRNRSSYRLWQMGVGLIGLTSLGIVISVVTGHSVSWFGT